MPSLPPETLLLRMSLSLLFGFLIGVERERKGKPAGTRTIALVSMGSTLMMLVAVMIQNENPNGTSDAIRMLQGIVTGIGFLGAGTVLHIRNHVQGLTTAAAVWMVAAIGATIGAGYYFLAVVSEALVLLLIASKRGEG